MEEIDELFQKKKKQIAPNLKEQSLNGNGDSTSTSSTKNTPTQAPKQVPKQVPKQIVEKKKKLKLQQKKPMDPVQIVDYTTKIEFKSDIVPVDDEFGNIRKRKITEDGLPVYYDSELKIGLGKDTPDCPFDCDCCF
jgi:hypothetical protein